MREAVIVASSRTPLAKSFRGSFNLTRPDDFTAHCIKDVLGKAPQLDSKEVEDVIMAAASRTARRAITSPAWRRCVPGCRSRSPGSR